MVRSIPVAAATVFDPASLLVFALIGATLGVVVCLFLLGQRSRELKVSDSRYRDVFDHAVVGMYELSDQGTFQEANPVMAQVLGYATQAELLALTAEQVARIYVAPSRTE